MIYQKWLTVQLRQDSAVQKKTTPMPGTGLRTDANKC